ncbi:MAG TPA: pyridoxine 5'-phosphate synthase [Planctomycetota bacterium]
MPRLHVNVDHVATVRQARRERNPDPVAAALLCELAGARGITVHLREDRRHIQDRDLRVLRETVRTLLNMEFGLTEEMLAIACEVVPDEVCIVPENRAELTTEGGLDAAAKEAELARATPRLQAAGIRVGAFIDPLPEPIEACARAGVDHVEFHTGSYANARGGREHANAIKRLETACRYAHELGLGVNAGHGLDYENVGLVAALPHVEALNIGHSIVARAVLVGMEQAVREMSDRILASAPEA